MMNYATENIVRNNMWTRLLGKDYASANRSEKKRMKQSYADLCSFMYPSLIQPTEEDMLNVPTIGFGSVINYTGLSSFGNCEVPCFAPTPCVTEECTANKGNKPMRYYDECNDEYVDSLPSTTDLATARSYLEKRLYDTYREKDSELEKTYHLHDDAAPKTVKEMVERITSGKFVAPDEKVDAAIAELWGYRPYLQIKWRDPAAPADKDGYAAAYKLLTDAKRDVLDIIKTSTEKEGLEALNAFKTKKFN